MASSETAAVGDVEALLALRQRVRAAWAPEMDNATAARLRTLEAEVDELLEEASIQAQRAKRQAADVATAARRIEDGSSIPVGTSVPVRTLASSLMSEAELRPVAGSGIWHLDPSQERPDWFPMPVVVDASLTG